MGGGGGEQTTTQSTDPWTEQQPYLKDLFGKSQAFFNQGTPDLTGATGAANDAVSAYRGSIPTVSNIASNAAGQQDFLSNGVLNPSANPALQQYINLANQETTTAFNQNVLPGLKSQALEVGGVGGSRAGIAEGLAAQGLQRQIAQQTAGITNAAYGQGLNAYTKGLALAPQTTALQGAEGQTQQQISSLLAGIETLPQDQQLSLLQAYQGLVGGGGYGGDVTSTGPGTETGGLSGALGGAAAGYGTTGSWWGAAAGGLAGYLS